MEAHYQIIAEQLHAACPKGYTRAWVEAEVSSSSSNKKYWCEVDGNEFQPETDGLTDLKVTRALIAVREAMGGNEANWSDCTFTLTADGSFKLDIHYD